MKRLVLSILAIFLLTAGAAMAQSAGTTAPGPTQQREPAQNSNNLPNPGNPQTDLSQNDTYTQGSTTATGTGTGVTGNETEQNEGVDVDVDTGARANGAVDVDVKAHGDADTDASGIDETGTGPATETGSADTADTLPDTASELPLLAIAGLLALASAFMVRLARRNA